jgi:GntR family transcriptional repressor for pyruvate dehydrogenase complex
MVKPYRSDMSAERVVEALERQLSIGIVKPGQRVPSERDLAGELGVNRADVRKGIRFLRAIGVVETRSGSGTFVTSQPPNLELEALTLFAPLQSFNQRESWAARRLLEVGLVGLAAKNASGDDFAMIAEEVTEMYASLDDRSAYLRHDIRFHHALGIAAKNPVLSTLSDMVSAMLYDVRRETAVRTQDLRQSVEMHRKIYNAVRSRREEEAKAAMSEHLIRAEHDVSKQEF